MNITRKIYRVSGHIRDYFAEEHVSLAPFISDIRHYSAEKLRYDFRAGANVSLLAVSQAIAFAAIAGLPVIYGVLCTAVAALIAPLFSASRHTIMGPTNATAFMLFSFISVNPVLANRWGELIPLLVMMVGVFATLGALMRMADLMQFVSRSVLVGYLTGAAVLIIANQATHLLGVSKWIDNRTAGTFVGLVMGLLRAISHIDWVSFSIGGITLGIYYSLIKWKPTWPVFSIALVIASAVFGSLIRFHVPPFEASATFETFSFHDMMPRMPHLIRAGIFNDISDLLGLALAIAFVATLENTLMAKALASRSGDHADVNQDMLSVGMANIASSIAGGMPASGSLTRSSLNFESGARTRFASFFSGVCSLGFATLIAASVGWGVPLINFVPKAALAALVIILSLSLFSLRNIRICLRSTGDDAAVLVVTFICTLLAPLHVAIFIGVALSISLFLRKASRPYLVEYEFNDDGELLEMGEKHKRPIPAISIVHVEGDLFFGAAELFRTQINRTVSDPAIQVIILRLKNARHLDATSVMALEDLIRFMRGRGLHLIVSGASPEVYRVLKRSGVIETLQEGCNRKAGESNLFLSNPRNPNLSTRGALKRAQQLLGTNKADIRIFHDPSFQSIGMNI